MTLRGAGYAGLIEAVVAVVTFVFLTMLPWWLAVGLVILAMSVAFLCLHLTGERHRRRIEKAERDAEFARRAIREDRAWSETLRCHGGVIR